MAADRFIWFKGDAKVPPKKDIESVLTNFFGEAAKVEWVDGRFYATLQGKPTQPFAGLGLTGRLFPPDMERWIEVYVAKDNIDVITRQADTYTNVLADGVAKLFAHFWQGELEDE